MRRTRSFTNIAAKMDPLGVVNMLNELYCIYDGLVDKHHVYKVRRASAARPEVVGKRSSKFISYEAGKLCSACLSRGVAREGRLGEDPTKSSGVQVEETERVSSSATSASAGLSTHSSRLLRGACGCAGYALASDANLTGCGGVQLETIGDAFMCAGGVPDAMTPAQGACAAADMALDMIEVSAGVC